MLNGMDSLLKFEIPEIIFGHGSIEQLGQCSRRLGGDRVMLVTDSGIIANGWVDEALGYLHQEGLKTIVFANQVQKTNFPHTQLVGDKCYKAFFHKTSVCRSCPVLRTIESEQNYTGEILVRDSAEKGRYYEWTTSPVKDPSGRVYEILLLMRDITERKEYEYRLMQSDRMAAIGFLAAGVAHEINNPLTSIAGFTEALLKRLKNISGEFNPQLRVAFDEYLGIINEEAYRCKEIIFNLQDFSRNSKDDFEPVSIDAIIRGTLSLFRQPAKDNNIRISYETQLDSEKEAIYGKKSQLKHLFLNLLIRAFKSVEEGGSMWIRALSKEKQVKIALCDSGRLRDSGDANHPAEKPEGNQTRASEILGINRKTLYKKIHRYKIFS
jgi:nitrogen-specific signal transduction histidine kinase